MTEIIEGGEPFYHPGNRVGCLLIHGFTGTPNEMRELGDHLAGCGYAVLGPRLFGHATQLEDLQRARRGDWIASVEDGYHLLRRNVDRLYAIGLSMGGALALVLAARTPVDGIVALATPHRLPQDPRLPFARQLSLIWRQVPKPGRDPSQPRSKETSLSYPAYPTRAIAELNDLLLQMRRSLPGVSAPALLIQSRQDPSLGVSSDAMPSIHEALGSRQKRMVWLQEAAHTITRQATQEKVFRRITKFIQDREQAHAAESRGGT